MYVYIYIYVHTYWHLHFYYTRPHLPFPVPAWMAQLSPDLFGMHLLWWHSVVDQVQNWPLILIKPLVIILDSWSFFIHIHVHSQSHMLIHIIHHHHHHHHHRDHEQLRTMANHASKNGQKIVKRCQGREAHIGGWKGEALAEWLDFRDI